MGLRPSHLSAIAALVSGALAVACGVLPRSTEWGSAARVALSLAPIVPTLWYCMLTIRAVREMDELQARIHFEGAVYGLLGITTLTMALGLLMKGGVLPQATLGQWWPLLWSAGFLFWAVGSCLAGRRYR